MKEGKREEKKAGKQIGRKEEKKKIRKCYIVTNLISLIAHMP